MSVPKPTLQVKHGVTPRLVGIPGPKPLEQLGLRARLNLTTSQERLNTVSLNAERINTLAHLIAGKPLPEFGGSCVDANAFLEATGFGSGRGVYSTSEEAINEHLFRLEHQLYPNLLFHPRTTYGNLGPLSLRSISPVKLGISQRTIDNVGRLLPRDVTYTGSPAEHLIEVYSRVMERQEAAKIMVKTLEHILKTMEETINGASVVSMRLEMFRKGFDVKKDALEVMDKDKHLLSRDLTVKLAQGKGTTTVKADVLLKALQDFIHNTKPDERGVQKGGAKYKGKSLIFKLAVLHPTAAKALANAIIGLFGWLIFKGTHGKEVKQALKRIIKKAFGDGHMAYLRLLYQNNQPINLKPQYLKDVTKSKKSDNAWNKTMTTPSGEVVKYAEVLKALRKLFSTEAELVYREWCANIMPQLGVKTTVVDPENSLGRLPKKPGIISSSHESYFDIATLGWVFMNHRHSFIARDNLVYYTGGIGISLLGALHKIITRPPKRDISNIEQAGFKAGDVIVGFNGIPIDKLKHLAKVSPATHIDKRFKVTVIRDGKLITLVTPFKTSSRIDGTEDVSIIKHLASNLGLEIQEEPQAIDQSAGAKSSIGYVVKGISLDPYDSEARTIRNQTISDYNQVLLPEGDNASITIFPQATRLRNPNDLDEHARLILRHERVGETVLGLAKTHSTWALGVTLVNTGNAFMYGKRLIKDAFGLRSWGPLGKIGKKRVLVFDPSYARKVRIHISPLEEEVRDPRATILAQVEHRLEVEDPYGEIRRRMDALRKTEERI